MTDRREIFRLIETADNFVKYARPGGRRRAVRRARRRLERAADLAGVAGDAEMLEQVRLRLEDLERIGALPEDQPDPGDQAVVSAPPSHAAERVPPGQRVVRGWPVLHEGPIPRFDPATWRLRVDGACAAPYELTYDELRALPTVEVVSDFHCVTGWSRLSNRWRGVAVSTLLERARPLPEARHALVHAEHGYTANVPLDVLRSDDVLVAWEHDGRPLEPRHGYPLRLVVPRLYAWKSVKWVRRFELLVSDRRGYWEVRGYHNRADPWREERYSYQES